MLNASNSDRGYADLMIRAELLAFKTEFASFCMTNHWHIVREYSHSEMTIESYGNATMRHSTNNKKDNKC
jgi:hypothetical protein